MDLKTVGGQNNHLDTRASLIKHSLLFRERQTAMKHTNPLCQSTFAKLTCQPLDVCLTGQEHQHHTSAMSHSHYFAKTMRSLVCSAWHCGITDINLKTFPLTTNNRRIKPGLQRFAVEGGRHHQHPQIGPEDLTDFPHQGKAQIRLQGPLMEFVKHNHADPLELRVGQ